MNDFYEYFYNEHRERFRLSTNGLNMSSFDYNNAIIWLKEGADINLTDRDNISFAMVFSYFGDINSMKYLIGKKADLSIVSYRGLTVFEYSFFSRTPKMMEFLLENGIKSIFSDIKIISMSIIFSSNWLFKYMFKKFRLDIDMIVDYDGNTLLIYSTKYQTFMIMKKLIKHGADINLENNYRQSALYFALENERDDFTELLLEKGAKINGSIKQMLSEINFDMYFYIGYIKKFNVYNNYLANHLIYKNALNLDVYIFSDEYVQTIVYTEDISRKEWNNFIMEYFRWSDRKYNTVKYLIISGIIDLKDWFLCREILTTSCMTVEYIDIGNLILENMYKESICKIKLYDREKISYDEERNRLYVKN